MPVVFNTLEPSSNGLGFIQARKFERKLFLSARKLRNTPIYKCKISKLGVTELKVNIGTQKNCRYVLVTAMLTFQTLCNEKLPEIIHPLLYITLTY